MRRIALLVIGVAVWCPFSDAAKTPDQLRQEIRNILPSGMKLRITWNQREVMGATIYQDVWTGYGVDSDDGLVREVTPASLVPNRNVTWIAPSRDGKYILFSSGTSNYVMNWDGSNLRSLPGSCFLDAWEDPAQKIQYAIVGGGTLAAGMWRVSLTDPTQRTKIYDSQLCNHRAPGHQNEGIGGTGISVDGLRVGGFICGSAPGIATTPSGSKTCTSCQGCNFTMRPVAGAAYEFGHFPDGHNALCMHNADGSKKGLLDNASTLPSHTGEPAGLYFTNHPDYVTYACITYKPQNNDWAKNPIIFCVATKKWAAIYDDLNGKVNRPQGVIVPSSGTSVNPAGSIHGDMRGSGNAQGRKAFSLYTLSGQRLGAGNGERNGILPRGIVIRAGTGAVSRVLVSP